MPNAIETQIQERIQAFVTEVEALVRRGTFDALRSALEGGGARARRSPPRGRAARAGGGASEGLADTISAHVRSKPGQTVGQIVSATGAKPAAVKMTIKAMLGGKQLRKAGQKRGTRYYPPGAGRLPGAVSARRGRGKHRARKPKRSTRKAMKAAKPKGKPRAAPRRKARAPAPAHRKGIVVPARRRPAPAPRPAVAAPKVVTTDVPEALAITE